jgi:hypothetical protein
MSLKIKNDNSKHIIIQYLNNEFQLVYTLQLWKSFNNLYYDKMIDIGNLFELKTSESLYNHVYNNDNLVFNNLDIFSDIKKIIKNNLPLQVKYIDNNYNDYLIKEIKNEDGFNNVRQTHSSFTSKKSHRDNIVPWVGLNPLNYDSKKVGIYSAPNDIYGAEITEDDVVQNNELHDYLNKELRDTKSVKLNKYINFYEPVLLDKNINVFNNKEDDKNKQNNLHAYLNGELNNTKISDLKTNEVQNDLLNDLNVPLLQEKEILNFYNSKNVNLRHTQDDLVKQHATILKKNNINEQQHQKLNSNVHDYLQYTLSESDTNSLFNTDIENLKSEILDLHGQIKENQTNDNHVLNTEKKEKIKILNELEFKFDHSHDNYDEL